jgi:magnesium-transporting ATPase (P-type)
MKRELKELKAIKKYEELREIDELEGNIDLNHWVNNFAWLMILLSFILMLILMFVFKLDENNFLSMAVTTIFILGILATWITHGIGRHLRDTLKEKLDKQ